MKVSLLRIAVLTLGLWCCPVGTALAQSKDAVKFFPDNTQMVFSVNVKSLIASPMFRKHFKEDLDNKIKGNDLSRQQFANVNLDPFRDIHQLTVTSNRLDMVAPNEVPDLDVFVIVKGTFNVEKMNAALVPLFPKASRYGDFTLFEVKDPITRSTFYGTVFDAKTILLGNVKEQVTEAIERGLGKKAGALNQKFSDLMGKARNEATLWAAIITPISVKEWGKTSPHPEDAETLGKLESQTLRVDVRDGVKFDFSVFLADAAAAKTLREQFEAGCEAAARLGVSELHLDILKTIQVASKDNKVSLSGEVNADLVERLVKGLKE